MELKILEIELENLIVDAKAHLIQKEYMQSLDCLKSAVSVLEKIVEINKDYQYEKILFQCISLKKSAMEGIIYSND